MSTNIVLPSLTDWTEQRVTALLTTTTEADFNTAFDAFLSKNVTITVNGQDLTRDQYKQQLRQEKFDEAFAQVQFSGAVEVPADTNRPIDAGTVGIFYTATINENILVLGAPSQSIVNSSLNVVVKPDESLQPPKTPGRGDFDPRRVSNLSEVTTDKPNPLIPLSTSSSSSTV
ncbi:hypothetical protein A0H81_02238 [Grifola frondosa]|uniref:Uncharacterized protein n=1 Tax=Grifola frondosa TaxID=5627 RepID=A0A1C7ML24_GRIFR|nr:hypothetical protein A0H81_02238 [Grifola frondosa]